MTNKLAVLISGSYRNFDQVWDKNKALIDQLQVPYEVFFHSWCDNAKNTKDVWSTYYKNRPYLSIFPKTEVSLRPKITQNFVQRTYGFSYVKIEEFIQSDVANRFRLGSEDSNSLFSSQLNSCGMYIGIDECAKAMQRVGGFTHFLRLRTDFSLGSIGLDKILEHDLVFYGQLLPTEEGPIGDQCFGGNLKKGLFVLDTMKTLEIMTSNQSWDINSPVVLSENIIRLTIKDFRLKADIIYLNNVGRITRVSLRSEFSKFSFKHLKISFRHNLNVIKWILSRVNVFLISLLNSK